MSAASIPHTTIEILSVNIPLSASTKWSFRRHCSPHDTVLDLSFNPINVLSDKSNLSAYVTT